MGDLECSIFGHQETSHTKNELFDIMAEAKAGVQQY